MPYLILIGAALGLILGAAIGYFLVRRQLERQHLSQTSELQARLAKDQKDTTARIQAQLAEAKQKAEQMVASAQQKNETIKKQKIAEARARYDKMKADYDLHRKEKGADLRTKEKELEITRKELQTEQRRLQQEQRDAQRQLEAIETDRSELETLRDSLNQQLSVVAKKKAQLDAANEERIKKLERIAGLSEREAKDQLLDAVRAKVETDAMAIVRDRIEQAKSQASREAKKIVIQTIQRMGAEHTIENTVSVFNLDSDDLKGQIIGREGRNIRALESATGAEIVVDDTPEAIVISSFDPIRREVCRLSLKRLVADGRIHPARIEEVVAKTRKQLDDEIREIGERTVIDLNIHGLSADLTRMVGRMRFRSSYGQNLLMHSRETAHLCATMAAELGLSKKEIKLAKRAGLLHDIGKVAEEETELSHALLGMELCKKSGEHPHVVNAVGAHHDEVEMDNIISPIVQACDAISGARPGARREILESYLKRINELEEIALSHDGVLKAYAMQAGRELRVIVSSERVSDERADDLSFQISDKIQNEMQYPGQIKVTVIREKRAVAYAR